MKLWLTGVEASKQVAGVKAIRVVATELVPFDQRGARLDTLRGAMDVWKRLARGEGGAILMLTTDDVDTLRKAASVLDEGGIDFQTTQDDEFPEGGTTPELRVVGGPDPQDPEPPSEEPATENGAVAWEVAATTLMIMAACDGNSGSALIYAKNLERTTGDAALYREVLKLLTSTFPPVTPQEIIHSIFNGDDDGTA